MAILINEKTKFLIQGITGKQGQQACQEMIKAGSNIVAGVTPGKGGEIVEGILVYNSVQEALANHSIDATVVYVPPRFAKDAIMEAINAKIPLINIITENIPIHDMAYCFSLAKKNNVHIIGPTSAGIYSVGKSKCGSLGSGKAEKAFTSGHIAVISRSGGMSCETSLVLTQAGLGQSTVVSIGSDVLMGDSFKELIPLFEDDSDTKGIVIYGEIGGTSEEDLAAYLIERKKQGKPFTKPVIAFISGEFAKNIHNVSLGHAGAIIEQGKGTRENKVKALKEAGVIVAEVHHEVGDLIKMALNNPIVVNNEINNNLQTKGSKEMEWKTSISKIGSKDVIIRNKNLSEMIQRGSFTDSIFFLLKGKEPNNEESILFEKILISIIDHGMGTTSSLTSRCVISGGNALNVGVAGGILSMGDYHGGAIENSMKQLAEWKSMNSEDAIKNITEAVSNKKTIFGFGHKHYKEGDPRVIIIQKEIELLGYESKHLAITDLIENLFEKIKGKKLFLNIDGLMAALLLDFGFDPEMGKGLFIIGRTPGLVAQCYEEKTSEKPVRRIPEESIKYLGDEK
ncbi:MAG: citryl-CoA lyase [archaeon]|nr:citryl-CoA lyase [archaeon]